MLEVLAPGNHARFAKVSRLILLNETLIHMISVVVLIIHIRWLYDRKFLCESVELDYTGMIFLATRIVKVTYKRFGNGDKLIFKQ